MKVVKKYYDLSLAEQEANRRKLAEGGICGMPEGAISEEQMEQEIAALIQESNESEKNSNFVADESKKERFGLISRSALLLAKYLELNVEIDTDNQKHSTIELSGGQVFLLKEMGKAAHDTVAMLFSSADESWIDGNADGVKLTFFYEVNHKVPTAG